MVPAGAIATDVLVRVGDDLVLAPIGDEKVLPENSGSMPLADVALDVGVVVATGAEAAVAFDAALDDWLVLTANALAGMASAFTRDRRRVRRRPRGVRPEDRRLPGAGPPARRLGRRGRRRAAVGPEGGVGARRGSRRGSRCWPPRRSRSRSRPLATRPTVRCTSTAATASCSSTTSSCTTAAVGRGRRSGCRRPRRIGVQQWRAAPRCAAEDVVAESATRCRPSDGLPDGCRPGGVPRGGP